MNLKAAHEIINNCLKKDPEFKSIYDCKFTSDIDEDIGLIFMLSKEENMSSKFKNILGDGSVQISYDTNRGGSILLMAEFEFGKWFNKIAENVDFALNSLGFEFKYQIRDHEDDYGYNNFFEIYRDNVGDDLEKELDLLLVIFTFILDA